MRLYRAAGAYAPHRGAHVSRAASLTVFALACCASCGVGRHGGGGCDARALIGTHGALVMLTGNTAVAPVSNGDGGE